MIDDMASLKQAMEQMDAEDATVAQAGKDRAAQLLSHAGLNFSRLGDLIEQHRLLLRPKIVASIKRMDQPAMLGDAAFRDSGASLRKEGQSFRQIAEALELRGPTAPRYEPPVHRPVLAALQDVPDVPEAQPRLPLGLRILLYPVRHPIQALVIAVLAVTLANGVREFAGPGQQISGHPDNTARRLAEASPAAPTPPNPIPSNSPTSNSSTEQSSAASPSSTSPTGPAPSASQSAPAVPASPSPWVPPASTPPRADSKSASPSTSGANNRPRTAQLRNFENLMPERLRRSSRSAGPCRGGTGGCYWGGGQY